jgi:hypothetical protein
VFESWLCAAMNGANASAKMSSLQVRMFFYRCIGWCSPSGERNRPTGKGSKPLESLCYLQASWLASTASTMRRLAFPSPFFPRLGSQLSDRRTVKINSALPASRLLLSRSLRKIHLNPDHSALQSSPAIQATGLGKNRLAWLSFPVN